jgi:hypothetical protein
MLEKRYFTALNGITRIKRAVKKYRTTDEPDDMHDQSARYLFTVLENMSVNPDLKWASALIVQHLHNSRLCTKEPVGDGTNAIYEINWPRIAHVFRAIARKKKRN